MEYYLIRDQDGKLHQFLYPNLGPLPDHEARIRDCLAIIPSSVEGKHISFSPLGFNLLQETANVYH